MLTKNTTEETRDGRYTKISGNTRQRERESENKTLKVKTITS